MSWFETPQSASPKNAIYKWCCPFLCFNWWSDIDRPMFYMSNTQLFTSCLSSFTNKVPFFPRLWDLIFPSRWFVKEDIGILNIWVATSIFAALSTTHIAFLKLWSFQFPFIYLLLGSSTSGSCWGSAPFDP